MAALQVGMPVYALYIETVPYYELWSSGYRCVVLGDSWLENAHCWRNVHKGTPPGAGPSVAMWVVSCTWSGKETVRIEIGQTLQ